MLKLDAVSVGYDMPVLQNIDLRFELGKVYAVIGKNGCGKSTLLKTMSGKLCPLAGSITVDGKDLGAFSPKERAKMLAYLPQARDIPNLSVRMLMEHGRFPYLGFPRILGERDRVAVRSAMELMDVTKFADKNVSCLSGGERQRVYLAMLLSRESQTMLLDEPTTYLDYHDAHSVLREICRLKEGRCIVTVLHDLSAAMQFADVLCLLSEKGLSFVGTPSELFESKQIERVFHVRGQRVGTAAGERYLFYL